MEETFISVEMTNYQKRCYRAILERNRAILLRGQHLSQTHAPTSTGELSAGPAALACSPPSLPRSPEEALHSLLPHERRRSALQPALTDSCPLVCRRCECIVFSDGGRILGDE